MTCSAPANVGAMSHKWRGLSAALAIVAVGAALGGCGDKPAKEAANPPASPAASGAAAEFASTLRDRIKADAMMAHLEKLQQIADAHDGNRALGTAGYDASVDYVANTLRDKGFDVKTAEFEARLPFAQDPPRSGAGPSTAAKPLQFTIGTPQQG